MHDDKSSIFHEKYDDNRMNLVIFEAYKGERFGGFNTKTWKGHCKKKLIMMLLFLV
jgi:hypothetical protein